MVEHSDCVNEPCPSCVSVGNDKTGNHLIVWTEGNSFCKRCGYTTNSTGAITKPGHLSDTNALDDKLPDSRANHKPTVAFQEIADISSLPSDKIRGIKRVTIEQYGIKVEYDPLTREITKHHYPVLSEGKRFTWKTREVATKKFFTQHKTKGTPLDFFGEALLKGKIPKRLLITEGELDAAAAHDMLKSLKTGVICVSLPTGANTSVIVAKLEMLQKVNELYLCLDQDDVGNKTTEEIWQLLPKARVMKFSLKDADEMLSAFKTGEFQDAFVNAERYKPETVIGIDDIDEDISIPLEYGLEYPWSDLTELTYGLRTGQIIGICSAPGAGKSTLMKGIQQKIMFDHKTPIGIIDTENPAWKVRRQLVGYMMNQKIWLPGAKYDGPLAKKTEASLKGKALFYAHNYYQGTWAELEIVIRYMHSTGIKYVFIDPLSSLVTHLSPSDANHWLSEAMYKMSLLVQVLDITIFHTNHLNGGADGKNSHESGGRVYAAQITGSRSQWRFSTDIWAIERNQHAESADEKNTNILRILKDRDVGNSGRTCKLLYNNSTGRLDAKPVVR